MSGDPLARMGPRKAAFGLVSLIRMPPISAAAIARSRTLGEARWSPGGTKLAWLDAFGGRVDLVVGPADGRGPAVTVTAEVPVTSLGAYGGGGYSWVDDDTLAYAAADGRLLLLPTVGGPLRVLSRDGRASAPAASPDGRRIAFVLERDDSCDIAVVDVDGGGWPERLSHADYAWDPTWSANGQTVAWHEWDLPNMPWDGSRIMAVAVDASDASPKLVAGADDVAVSQPRFAPIGDALAFVAETDGWMNVWTVAQIGASPTCVLPEPHEHAEPSWGPGQRSFAWAPDASALALCRNEDGFGRLVVVPIGGRDTDARDVSKGWHHGLDWGAGGIACVRSGGRTAPQLTVVDPATGARDARLRGAPAEFDAADLPEPTPITWAGADGATVHGLLWLPLEGDANAGAPPLLVDVHGGPTDQTTVDWRPRVRWFLSRGWAVLSPNYRGSTGYGREYRHALDHAWGEVDVTDTVAGIRALAHDDRVDASRAAVMGGSAGGFTALLVAAHTPPVVRAAVSLFGVTDLFDLAATTHRFESRYLDRLVGTLPEHADRYAARSPVAHARDITVPVLVLQGADDKVVPPAQAQLLVDAVRAAGGTVEQHVYDGEGHGFSKEATIIDSFERIDAFLTRWVVKG
jgi:dipeptidyl aminopeptidase/acylaminoacyl peptidase